MTTQDIKITQNRIAVIIGKGGRTRRQIEKKTKAKIEVDSEDGIVTIESDDPISVLNAVDVITAINRGFSPERAYTLLEDEDVILEIIDLGTRCNTPKQMERIRGRIIGKAGKSREQIENMTGAEVSVYGKTVAVIGSIDQVKTAMSAIEMLIEGISHESVFSYLDKKKKEAKTNILEYYY
ncbi:KH domain-containing protein [Methanomicrobium antiquum]|uniref:KH domain-containing protein n=1 Tax=Methanomicrobium antiquum TaxID=487686 RepID=A0AAF0JM18_9EURY|nr:KH domain-containing protein [Methanomicrobium antiquum]MDD3978134.1 KH domain-containing protein [Methanomicrobium sp.]WFN36672.1 KH domain-containing protein [Methanomicrobium antiquum]